jgi:hypothetical protein
MTKNLSISAGRKFLILPVIYCCLSGLAWATSVNHDLPAISGVDIPKPPGKPSQPPEKENCYCPQNYDPVVCDGGAVFPNACVAGCAGANNCGTGTAKEPDHRPISPLRDAYAPEHPTEGE